MEETIQKQIEARMAELPEDVRHAILASDFEDKVRAIGTKHNLHIDQMGALGDEVMLAMLGFTKLDMLNKEIASQLSLPQAQADAITAEINEQIFLAIRESLKNFTEKPSSTPAPAATPLTPVPAPVAAIPPAPAAPVPPVPAQKPVDVAAEVMLTQTTSSVAPVAQKPAPPPADSTSSPQANPAPAAPVPYKTDPYREPPE